MQIPDVQERYIERGAIFLVLSLFLNVLLSCICSYGLYLRVYLQHCGTHRIQLGQQVFVMQRLEEVARAVRSQVVIASLVMCISAERNHLSAPEFIFAVAD